MNEDLVKGIEAMGRSVGLGGLAGAVLRDHRAPDPVIPPDLHLVKPVVVDADGNVRCIYCGRAVKWETAQLVGSAGYECGTCQHAYNHQPALSLDAPLRRRLWPWAVGAAAVMIGAGVGIWQYLASQERAQLEKDFPVAATAEDEAIMDKHLDRWRDNVDELAAAIGNPPALKTVELTATPCDRSIDGAMEFHGHDATREEVKRQVVGLIEHAERGRFVHELHRAMVMRELQAPVLVIAVHHDQRAKLHREDPSDAYFDHGERAGTAYLFEPDGKLVCAGAFEATSSDQVEWTKYTYGHETEEEKRGVITDGDDISVRSALDRDLDKRMHQALAASLKRVQ